MSVSRQFLDQFTFRRDEYDLIVSRLGQEPNDSSPGRLW
jgi:hypothetical protein